ncbi:unnamed protein product [Aureobasidium mustum]|uniref:Uncharacterized protein n=1 Tax=Aureobasidium mustum TaxID=2773714 RepID=A0A9N8K2S1_9PEZI|nr:unnamed protein product [Aureobasidium mustum]
MSSNTMEISSTNNHENNSIDHKVTQDKMEVEHVNKKPIKRIVPEKIAEVGQWKVAKMEDKTTDEEDKAVQKEDKALNELHKAHVAAVLVEMAKTN